MLCPGVSEPLHLCNTQSSTIPSVLQGNASVHGQRGEPMPTCQYHKPNLDSIFLALLQHLLSFALRGEQAMWKCV